MKNSIRTLRALILCGGCLLAAGCQPQTTSKASGGDQTGAFPPTLSDTDYHQNAWTRSDCLVCHEKGVQNAPKVKHVSLPEIALQAKCRTCHVQIKGQKPASTAQSDATHLETSALATLSQFAARQPTRGVPRAVPSSVSP
ncbi:MAG: hypothetical protein KDA61_21670 [Planctomycetales bacterium]|nr:hypothetical protein [Planctomycetales bacterium]